MAPGDRIHDVVVVGAGPAGASCAYWLAEAGWDVAVVEKKHFPREKTCGDGLTPRAVRQLADMGLEGALAGAHRYVGLRSLGFGQVVELAWPEHPVYPSYGYTITRHDLDGLVAGRAAKAGAKLWEGTEAVAPILANPGPPPADRSSRGNGGVGRASVLPPCLGVTVRDTTSGATRAVRARYLVVTDGSNSRLGRALGTARRRDYPLGMALRGYFRSPRHDDPFIESHLDIRDPGGTVVPGYGWIFPMGDGRVNVGVGLLSTAQRWKGVNTSALMDTFVSWAPKSWELSPETACGPPTGGKLPMGLAVGPRVGPNVVVAGDAGGSINPFNGEGIAYGYETGRLAASALATALAGEGDAALMGYEHALEEAYARYYRLGRLFVRVIGRPAVMQAALTAGMRSERLMGGMVRVMANILRPGAIAVPELGYRAAAVLAAAVPEPGGRAERAAVPEQRPPAPAIGEEPAA